MIINIGLKTINDKQILHGKTFYLWELCEFIIIRAVIGIVVKTQIGLWYIYYYNNNAIIVWSSFTFIGVLFWFTTHIFVFWTIKTMTFVLTHENKSIYLNLNLFIKMGIDFQWQSRQYNSPNETMDKECSMIDKCIYMRAFCWSTACVLLWLLYSSGFYGNKGDPQKTKNGTQVWIVVDNDFHKKSLSKIVYLLAVRV